MLTKITLPVLLLAFALIAYQQSTAPTTPVAYCCDQASVRAFTQLAQDPAFVAKHENPLPFHFENRAGEMITYKTPDGQTAKAFYIKAAKKSKHFLFVFQEWWGLNDYIRQEASRFAGDLSNVNIIAPDMYDGNVATNRDEAAKYMQATKPERLEAIIQGALNFAGPKAKIATVGWCFGGGLSLNASLLAQKKAAACVMYYGMPIQDIEKLKTLETQVLGIFGKEDKWINPEVVAEFERNMATAGKTVKIKMYEADHAFANPSNPKYQKDFAEEAYQASLGFIKSGLGL
ncbi:MAG: dienelactone hydrolase family protein [Microscillaceae bacterium]|nr:dienelactone hydrolase family protein [Microscillaceae bacterium]